MFPHFTVHYIKLCFSLCLHHVSSFFFLFAIYLRAKPDIVRSNIEVLVQEGLGEKAENDFLLAQGTCQALLKLTVSKVECYFFFKYIKVKD